MYSHNKRQGKQSRKAFSLVEIMVVIVIIGLLAGVLAVNVRGSFASANVKTAKLRLANVANQVDFFKGQNGNYPTAAEGLAALTRPDVETGIAPCKESEIIDPWKNKLVYVVPGPDGQPFEIICLGADGKEGGDGENQDISHLDL